MPLSDRIQIPYPAENKPNWYSDFTAMVSKIDTSLYANREDRNLLLMGGGAVSFSVSGTVGTLSWDEDIEILSTNTGFSWIIPASSISLENDELFYVNLVRAPTADVDLDFVVDTVTPNSDDSYIIGIFKTDRVYFINGDVIFDGESFDLFSASTSVSSLSSANPSQIDAGDTADPGVSTAGSRSDHSHSINTAVAGDLVAIDAGSASGGVSSKIPRADHKHTVTTGTPGSVTFASASAGSATSLAKSDHVHAMVSGTPSDTGTTNSQGSSANPARVDHVHKTIVRFSQSGSLISSQPEISFSGQSFTVTNNGGSNRAEVVSNVDVGLFVPDMPDAAALVLLLPMTKTIIFPIHMTGSRALAKTASTGTVMFSLQKNDVEFATITFTSSATGVFTAASQTTFTNTDKLTIIAPNPQDATLADIGINLSGTK